MKHKIVDCPALRERLHEKGYPFGENVPLSICMKRTVGADFPMLADTKEKAKRDMWYPAWTNSYGAVSVMLPDGKLLGVKPDEFEVVEWLEILIKTV